jgi:hypothetical protein
VVDRWSEYLESPLNVDDYRRANLTSMGRGVIISRNLVDHNAIERQKVEERQLRQIERQLRVE